MSWLNHSQSLAKCALMLAGVLLHIPMVFLQVLRFSILIGGTHNNQVTFWQPGQLASTGIKSMAEFGGTSDLSPEVQTAINAGTADAVILGGAIGQSPGSTSSTFTANQAFPLVTLVTMVAPSPDWFVLVCMAWLYLRMVVGRQDQLN